MAQLVVKRQGVSSGLPQATDKWDAFDALVWSMPVVVMNPAFKRSIQSALREWAYGISPAALRSSLLSPLCYPIKCAIEFA